jgi:hypothetical protein
MKTKIHIVKRNGRWTWITRSRLSFVNEYPSMHLQTKANQFCKALNAKEPSPLQGFINSILSGVK